MKRVLFILLALTLICGLAACSAENLNLFSSLEPPATSENSRTLEPGNSGPGNETSTKGSGSNILIAYCTAEDENVSGIVKETAVLLQKTVGGDLFEIKEKEASENFSPYEFVLLGFAGERNTLPEPVRSFLEKYDFGAKTIFPFVTGSGNNSSVLLSEISKMEPVALLGDNTLIFCEDTEEQEITQWAQGLGLSDGTFVPESSESGNTVATAAVMPDTQQVLYLWEEGNAPATTEYTVNNGEYSDDPDFRPYLTSFPVP